MLVLTRRVGERVIVQEGLELVVLEVRGKQVKLGFKGDRSIRVRRAELPPLNPDGGGGEQRVCA